jgi:hypothetical protein
MKICYLDAFSGISGDMLVAALADAGADRAALVEGLSSLGTGAHFEFTRTLRCGIAATKFSVIGGDTHTHRHLSAILKMIGAAPLAERVRSNAAAVFERLGAVEAAIHGIPVEKVHFHEVGAVDSIADIVGACLGFELVGVEEIHSSPLNLGSGTVEADHGTLPVPAPATAALVAGKPVYARGPEVELTTPTGAAIATTLARRFGVLPPMSIASIGYGAGEKDLPGHANLLRVLIGGASRASEAVTVSVIETNVDDVSPELLGYTMERLFEAGALDVTIEALLMKKNRPGALLRVIARPEDQEALAQLVFAETSTLGLRIYSAERRVQARSTVEVETPHGKVRIKVSDSGSYAPEYEDCRKLARKHGVPLRQIFAEANDAYLRR